MVVDFVILLSFPYALYLIVSIYSELEKPFNRNKELIKDKHSCVTNGSMFDLMVFVFGGYIKSVVCLHLPRPVLGSYIAISPANKS